MIPTKYVKFLLIGFFFSFLIQLVAQNNVENDFKKANSFYQSNNYTKALEVYLSLLKKEHYTAEVYFNTGNVYFKLDSLAQAICYYEKALKLSPNDEDIMHNLAIAQSKTVDKIEALPQLFYKIWWQDMISIFTSNQWAYITLFLFCIAMLGLGIYFFSNELLFQKIGFYTSISLVTFTIVLFFIGYSKLNQEKSTTKAIILSQSIYVKSSPTDKSTDLFILHEGTKIEQKDKIGDWIRIKLANGNEGWILKNTVLYI